MLGAKKEPVPRDRPNVLIERPPPQCRPKGLLKNPLFQSGQPLLNSRNPGWQAHPVYKAWFPKTWVSVLQKSPFITNMAEANSLKEQLLYTISLIGLQYKNPLKLKLCPDGKTAKEIRK